MNTQRGIKAVLVLAKLYNDKLITLRELKTLMDVISPEQSWLTEFNHILGTLRLGYIVNPPEEEHVP
jgi:SpoU rRNA methylase family enzyme